MKRRVVPSRLVPDTEHPEHRTDFRHPDLESGSAVTAASCSRAVLTIWRNWIAKGRPEADAAWAASSGGAATVGGALQAAGIDGVPLQHRRAGCSDSEDDDDGWGDHLAQLRARFGDGWFTVADVAEAVDAGYLKRPPVKQDPDKTLAAAARLRLPEDPREVAR